MIEKIGHHTEALVQLFPAQKEREKALCGKETLELIEGVQLLKDLVKDQDQPLASALETLIKPLGEQYNVDISGGTVGVGQSVHGNIEQTFHAA